MTPLNGDLQPKIEDYLLGRLARAEQSRIESLLFEDDEVFEAIRAAEDDLIDRYLAGELSSADKEAFERKFAASPSRQERIAIARTVSRALTPEAARAAEVATAPARRAWLPSAKRLSLPAGAGLAAALIVAIVWLGRLTTRVDQVGPQQPAVQPMSSASTVTTEAPPAPALFLLRRVELRRGEGRLPVLRIAEGTAAIRLRAELEAPMTTSRHAVALRRVEGSIVWRGWAQQDADRRTVTVTVPARVLEAGDYVLSLTAPESPPEDAAEYLFRVSRPD
jgi:pyruvate/2-oxoglutarate dehydrogenase complex dihydrolipoamide acyltransferase (E2) component